MSDHFYVIGDVSDTPYERRTAVVALECIPISMYCAQTGETLDAVNKRIQRGIWREGTHVLKIEGVKERWIDLAEVSTWARSNGKHHTR